MISTLIRVGSIILLIIIFSNIWAQKKAQEEQNKKIENKKNKNK